MAIVPFSRGKEYAAVPRGIAEIVLGVGKSKAEAAGRVF